MVIQDIRINGIEHPIGHDFPFVSVSWRVGETASLGPAMEQVTIAEDESFAAPVWERRGALSSLGTEAAFPLKPRTRYYVRVSVTGDGGDSAEGTAFFETGKRDEPWQAQWIGTAPEDGFHPVFFRDFTLEKPAARARIYVTGLGLYEAFLNGEKIGGETLMPGFTDYRELVQVQTYDVSALLRKGENRLEIFCGNGWYKGRLGYEGRRAIFGDRFSVLAELRMTAEDGEETVLGTDGRWRYRGSDFEATDIYDGENLNRLLWQGKVNPEKPARVLGSADREPLADRMSLPVIVKDTLRVVRVIHTPAGEIVLDMGQNFVGYMEYDADFPAGTRIVLDHGEILQDGNFYNGNYRSAKAQMIYVSDGRRETVRAHFTFFGFRYVRVAGWPGEVSEDAFRGRVVYSDLQEACSLVTPDAKLNRLYLNTLWGQRSNFLDIPTDCPQRDERLGWTGDAQVFSPTACYQMDTRAFYRKFLRELRLDQKRRGGAIANYLPNLGGMPAGSSVWGDVATFLPMTLYEVYGSEADLREDYPMMRDWVQWIRRQDDERGGKRLWNFGFHFGDWLAQDGMSPQSMKGGTDDYFIASAYYHASAKKTARAAEILGYAEEAADFARLAEEVRAAMLEEYFAPGGRLCVDTQTAYLVCLNFGIYRKRESVIEGLKTRLYKDGYHIRGGFVGATMMNRVLAENGMEDLAAYFLFQEGYPGWMHCVNLGATTIWERWNSVLDDGHISGTGMNSLNHYAYGSVMEYVYRDLAGIRPLAPGFRKALLAPQVTGRLGEMAFAYRSASGVFASRWKILPDGQITVGFDVPFGAEAEAWLPGTEERISLRAGSWERTYRPERDFRLKYGWDSRLGEMAEDPEALAILKEDLPPAYALIKSDETDFLNSSMRDLQTLFFRGFNPPMVQEGVKRLFTLKWQRT